MTLRAAPRVATGLSFTGGMLAILSIVAAVASMMAYALTGLVALHTLMAGTEEPRAVARQYLHHRGPVRLACLAMVVPRC